MGSFKTFLKENDDLLQQIYDILGELTEEELDEFGEFLYYEFFDNEETEEDDYIGFAIEDVKAMIVELGVDFYEELLELLLPEELELEDDEDVSDGDTEIVLNKLKQVAGASVDAIVHDQINGPVDETVARRFSLRRANKKKRKFMTKSKADLRKGAAERKRKARLTAAARKRYYRANRQKIKMYQKTRSAAIKKGKHFVKVRRGA